MCYLGNVSYYLMVKMTITIVTQALISFIDIQLPTKCSSVYSPRCLSLSKMVLYWPRGGYHFGRSLCHGRLANIFITL